MVPWFPDGGWVPGGGWVPPGVDPPPCGMTGEVHPPARMRAERMRIAQAASFDAIRVFCPGRGIIIPLRKGGYSPSPHGEGGSGGGRGDVVEIQVLVVDLVILPVDVGDHRDLIGPGGTGDSHKVANRVLLRT